MSVRMLPDKLYYGKHSPDGEMCAMEAVAWLADEPWSDHPTCASPEISEYVRVLNDRMPGTERQRLLPLLPRLLNTSHLHPRFEFADTAVRIFAPIALDAIKLTDCATKLRLLAPIIDRTTAADAAVRAAAVHAEAAAYAVDAAYAADAAAAAYAAAYAADAVDAAYAADAAAATYAADAAAYAADAAAVKVWSDAIALLDRLLPV